MTSKEQAMNWKLEASHDVQKDIKDSIGHNCDILSTGTSERHYVKSLEHMFYDTIDGINYYSVTANGRVKSQHPIIRDLQLRSDDVIACGYPKSGNHWIFEVLTMIFRQNTDFNEQVYHTYMLEFLSPDAQFVINAIKSPRSLTSHLRCHKLPLQVVEKRLKIVYILRNPKDIIFSMYHMFNSNGPLYMRYSGTFNEFFDIYMKGEFFWGLWFDHVWSYEKFINENPDHPVFILSFEKMKEDPVKMIKDLCSFLGKPDILAENIAGATEFNNMKSSLAQGKMKEVTKLVCQEGMEFIFRKGEIGDWRNRLTVEQSRMLDKMFDERMSGSKLANIVREYI